MKFEPGKEKTGGRKAGTPNKNTVDIKTRIAALIDEQFEAIQYDLGDLDPKDRVAAYLKFLEYVLPRQRENKVDLNSRLDTLSDEQLNKLIDSIITS